MKLIFSLLSPVLPLWIKAQTTTQNYIVTTVPFQAVSNPLSLTDAYSNTVIQFIDGVGGLSQTVLKAITPLGADLVNAVEYDVFSSPYRTQRMALAEDLQCVNLRFRKMMGMKFRRQHPIDIYIVDFISNEKRFIWKSIQKLF